MTSFRYTVFRNVQARKAVRRSEDWPALVKRLAKPQEYRDKKAMPLLSLCRYGDRRSPAGSLRHAANVKAVYGIELDYDGGKVTPEEARDRFRKAGIRALVYTSPSHKPDHPKWRALLPLSEPVAPDRRAEMVGKANRVLGGIAARESFTLSQSFYFGRKRKAEYLVFESKGRRCIDRHKARAQHPKESKKDGKGGAFEEIPDDQFIEAFEKGEGRYNAALALSARWIGKGRNPEKVRKELHKYVRLAEHDGIKPKTTQGENLYKQINKLVDSAYAKFGADAATRKETRRREASFNDVLARREEREREADPNDWVRRVLAGEHEGRVNFAGIRGRTIPPQEWVVEHFIPRGVLTLVHGNGGVGKSLVMLALAGCVAAGQDVLGKKVQRGPVIFISAEESKHALEARIQNVMVARNIKDPDLTDTMTLISQLQGGFPMFYENGDDGSTATAPGYHKLAGLVAQLKPVMVVIENVANVYRANENWRTQVEQFTGLLNGLAAANDCAVVLIGHDSKLGEYSGSSHWNNGPRHRIHVKRDGMGKPTVVTVAKTNCDSTGRYFHATWNDDYKCFDLGALVGHRDLKADLAQLLRPLAQAIEEGRRVSAAKNSPNNAHRVLSDFSPYIKTLNPKSVFDGISDLLRLELIAAPDKKDGKGNPLAKVIELTTKGQAELLREDASALDEEPTDDELETDELKVARKGFGKRKANSP